MAAVDTPLQPDNTSDAGGLYIQELRRRGVPLLKSNLQQLIVESRRNPDLIPGLRVQQAEDGARTPDARGVPSGGRLPIPPQPPGDDRSAAPIGYGNAPAQAMPGSDVLPGQQATPRSPSPMTSITAPSAAADPPNAPVTPTAAAAPAPAGDGFKYANELPTRPEQAMLGDAVKEIARSVMGMFGGGNSDPVGDLAGAQPPPVSETGPDFDSNAALDATAGGIATAAAAAAARRAAQGDQRVAPANRGAVRAVPNGPDTSGGTAEQQGRSGNVGRSQQDNVLRAVPGPQQGPPTAPVSTAETPEQRATALQAQQNRERLAAEQLQAQIAASQARSAQDRANAPPPPPSIEETPAQRAAALDAQQRAAAAKAQQEIAANTARMATRGVPIELGPPPAAAPPAPPAAPPAPSPDTPVRARGRGSRIPIRGARIP